MRNRGVHIATCLFLGIAFFLAVPVLVHAQPTTVKSTATLKFSSPGQFATDQITGPLVQRIQAIANIPLSLPHHPRVSRSHAPLRHVELLGGDRITAEIVRWEDDELTLRLRGGQTVVVPRIAITHIASPRGETEVLYDSYEQNVVIAVSTLGVVRPELDAGQIDSTDSASEKRSLAIGDAGSVVYAFRQPLSSSRVQFWFRVHNPADEDPELGKLSVNLDFQTDAGTTSWTMHAANDHAWMESSSRDDVSTTRQLVPLKKGWHCCSVVCLDEQAIVVVDQALLIAAPRVPGKLKSIRFSSTQRALVDDLQVNRLSAPIDEPVVRPSTQDDCVALQDGDQWFGRVKGASVDSVILAGVSGERVATWSSLSQIALRQPDRAVPAKPCAGLWAKIELQGNIDRKQFRDQFCVAIQEVTADYLRVQHPWMGRFAIGWSDISRIDLQFVGVAIAVDGRRLHLGDAIRSDFRRPIPDGTEWTSEFELSRPVSADAEVWLSLDAVELEPVGPGTPPASPFLKELTKGRLLTEISINDHSAGTLNQWVRFRANPNQPERIRCRVPVHLLRTGNNSIRLSQIPLKESGTTYDNCELSNLRIEMVEPALFR